MTTISTLLYICIFIIFAYPSELETGSHGNTQELICKNGLMLQLVSAEGKDKLPILQKARDVLRKNMKFSAKHAHERTMGGFERMVEEAEHVERLKKLKARGRFLVFCLSLLLCAITVTSALILRELYLIDILLVTVFDLI